MQNVALAWLVLSLSRSPLAVAPAPVLPVRPVHAVRALRGLGRRPVRDAPARDLDAGRRDARLGGARVRDPDGNRHAARSSTCWRHSAASRSCSTARAPVADVRDGRPQELPNAVALNSGLVNASRIVGPAIAGVIIAVAGVGLCFVVNTISFLAVLAALLAMRTAELYPVAADRSVTLLTGTREGLAFAWHDRAGARRPRRDDVRRARRLQLQHARAAARLGHAARRRPRVRAPLGCVRAGSVLPARW